MKKLQSLSSSALVQGFFQVYIGKDTAFKVTRLLPGSVYRFRVLVSN